MHERFGMVVYDQIDEMVDPRHAVVLVIDVQNDFCSPGGAFDRAGKDLTDIQALLPRLRGFLQAARAFGVPVVFIQQTTLPDGRSDSPAWLRVKTRDGKDGQYTLQGTWGHEFVAGCEPQPGEVVIQKHRSSAFVGTPLEYVLRSRGVKTVIPVGVVTQGCVESTARHASFLDFYVVLPEDLVASNSRQLHEASLLVQRVRYDVTDSATILKAWRETAGAGRKPSIHATGPQSME